MVRFVFGGIVLFSSFCFASFQTFEFHDRLASLLNSSMYKDVRVGINIQNLSKEGPYKVVYEKNKDDYFIPASMMKLMLSATVFSYFHPLEKFETPIYTNGFISNNILHGDLILKGIGDPSLTTTHLRQIVQAIGSLGIHEIDGDIIYDNSFFEEPVYRGHSARYYNALSSALNLNNNVVQLKINDFYTGIEAVEPSSYITLVNKSRIDTKSKSIGFPGLFVTQLESGDRYKITGTVTNVDEDNHNLECAITRPSLYFSTFLYELFERNGINITGQVEKGGLSENAVLLGLIKGNTVKEVVTELNQDSNNMIADSLCKSLGGSLFGAPGTTEKGVAALKQFCKDELSISEQSIFLEDGSGLSTKNKVTPSQFSTLLENVYGKPKIGTFLIDSLVKQGNHPDHLKPSPPSYLDVRLKTGTLAQHGVNTVGGYIFDKKNNEVYTFVIMTERQKPSPKAYQGTYTNPLLSLIFSGIR